MKPNDRTDRSSDKIDFLHQDERREHARFQSNAFLGVPLFLTPLPPFFGSPIDGQVIDLSGGGMAVLIKEMLPIQTRMSMELKFPSGMILSCLVIARRTSACTGGFLTGLQFLDLPTDLVSKIDQMAQDYNECDKRIEINETPICINECAFFSICDKPQKRAMVRNNALEMILKIQDQKTDPSK